MVYGDTDSLFVYLPGKTREQAFLIGHDIANTITSMNPAPVKLKFEKVEFNLSRIITNLKLQVKGLPTLRSFSKKALRWIQI